MELKYKNKASFSLNSSIVFYEGDVKTVDDEEGNRLLNTFPSWFEIIRKDAPKVKKLDGEAQKGG